MASRVALNLNPKFTFFSPVTAGTGKQLLAEQVDHAIIALDGRAPAGGHCSLELLEPLADAPTTLRIDLWVNDLEDYTCTYGFTVSSENGTVPYARGERIVVNIDPRTRRADKWSNAFRASHAELIKDLPAFA
jgi:hypothetical protein